MVTDITQYVREQGIILGEISEMDKLPIERWFWQQQHKQWKRDRLTKALEDTDHPWTDMTVPQETCDSCGRELLPGHNYVYNQWYTIRLCMTCNELRTDPERRLPVRRKDYVIPYHEVWLRAMDGEDVEEIRRHTLSDDHSERLVPESAHEVRRVIREVLAMLPFYIKDLRFYVKEHGYNIANVDHMPKARIVSLIITEEMKRRGVISEDL